MLDKISYQENYQTYKLKINFPAPKDLSILDKRDANQMVHKYFGGKTLNLSPDIQASTDKAYYIPGGFRYEPQILVFVDIVSMYDPMDPFVQKQLHKSLADLHKKSQLGPLPKLIKISPTQHKGRLAMSPETKLKKELIRLAQANPLIRKHLLPLLKESSCGGEGQCGSNCVCKTLGKVAQEGALRDQIEHLIKVHWPNSFLVVREQRGAIFIQFALGKKGEWPNNIIHNDPLHHQIWIWDVGTPRQKMELSLGGSVWGPNGTKLGKIGWRNAKGDDTTILRVLDMYFGRKMKDALKLL